jgi:hypothetical protein
LLIGDGPWDVGGMPGRFPVKKIKRIKSRFSVGTDNFYLLVCMAKKLTIFPCQGVLLLSQSCELLDKENVFVYTAAKENLTSVQEILVWF